MSSTRAVSASAEIFAAAFLNGDERRGERRWSGTLLTDRYGGYEAVVDPQHYPGRMSAACAAHARRNFEELAHEGTSPIGLDALRRFARIYEVEGELKALSDEERRAQRQRLASDIHDSLAQGLNSIVMLSRAAGAAHPSAAEEFSRIERTAREGVLMPPKSTFFTPKLRTGFVIRPLA